MGTQKEIDLVHLGSKIAVSDTHLSIEEFLILHVDVMSEENQFQILSGV